MSTAPTPLVLSFDGKRPIITELDRVEDTKMMSLPDLAACFTDDAYAFFTKQSRYLRIKPRNKLKAALSVAIRRDFTEFVVGSSQDTSSYSTKTLIFHRLAIVFDKCEPVLVNLVGQYKWSVGPSSRTLTSRLVLTAEGTEVPSEKAGKQVAIAGRREGDFITYHLGFAPTSSDANDPEETKSVSFEWIDSRS